MKMIYAMVAAILLAAAPYAQERSATGAMETQVTWSALSSQIKTVDAKVTALDSKLNEVIKCGDLGMVYGREASVLKCIDPKVDLAALTTAINNLTTTQNNILYCSNLGMIYAPTASGHDAHGCVATGGGLDVGNVVTSINGNKGFPPNTILTAASDLFVSASSYGGGGESCPVSGRVNGVQVAYDYAIRYASSVAFLVPKGKTWQVVAQGGNCSGRQVNISVVPLN